MSDLALNRDGGIAFEKLLYGRLSLLREVKKPSSEGM